jgi:hypothetical protein
VLNLVTEKNDGIALLIREYEGTKKWIYKNKAENSEKYEPILERIKSEAIGIMIRCKEVNESQLRPFGLANEDSINTCDSCWDSLQLYEFDNSESFSDADPGL